MERTGKFVTAEELESVRRETLEEAAKNFENLYWGLASNKEAAACCRALAETGERDGG